MLLTFLLLFDDLWLNFIFDNLHLSKSVLESNEKQAAASDSSSSVSFDCDPSHREAKGTAELGEELFAVFERCHASGMTREQISIAIGLPTDQVDLLFAQLRSASKPRKRKSRSRVVRVLPQEIDDPDDFPQKKISGY